jgi:hypothetical protein
LFCPRFNTFYYLYSAIHQIHPSPVPLDNQARLWIKLNADTLARRENLGIVEIKKTGKSSWIGGDLKMEAWKYLSRN